MLAFSKAFAFPRDVIAFPSFFFFFFCRVPRCCCLFPPLLRFSMLFCVFTCFFLFLSLPRSIFYFHFLFVVSVFLSCPNEHTHAPIPCHAFALQHRHNAPHRPAPHRTVPQIGLVLAPFVLLNVVVIGFWGYISWTDPAGEGGCVIRSKGADTPHYCNYCRKTVKGFDHHCSW